MKHGIIKFWVCKECAKEYIDRPLVCSKCDNLEFELKYGGLITDAEELEKLIETYKHKDDDEPEKNKRIRM